MANNVDALNRDAWAFLKKYELAEDPRYEQYLVNR
jgi:hypothetical protein